MSLSLSGLSSPLANGKHCGQKLAGHISRDATAIEAREKPVKAETSEAVPKLKGKRGRPRKDEVLPPKPQKRVELQAKRSLDENLKDLPTFSKSLGHMPIIDHNPRRGEKILMDPATKSRFAERTSVERVNSNLLQNVN